VTCEILEEPVVELLLPSLVPARSDLLTEHDPPMPVPNPGARVDVKAKVHPVVQSQTERPIRKLLVADDEMWVRRLVAATLMGEPYEVIEACDGAEAVELTRTERPDLVLLDVHMPGLDGLAACRQIKDDPELAGTTVIILSGDRLSDARGTAAGANHVFVKPFSPLQLLGFIERALG
jgi:two-component system, OmpR family, alkaline phosphatase synthesis response regulator PhoP